MLRDMPSLKFFRRNSGKNLSSLPESNENLHANPVDSSSIHLGSESGRPPLNAIPEPSQNPKSVTEQEIGPKVKIDRTPTKNKVKGLARSDVPDLPLPFRTPDKQGFASLQSRNKFGWAQKSESVSNVSVGGKSPGCSSTQSTPNKSVTKPSNPAFAPLSSSRPPLGMATRAANFNTISKGISIPSTLPVVVNTAEVPHFELKEDPSFWMDHNVQVLIRIRPLNGTERSLQGYSRCLRQESAHGIAWIGQPETRFTFDHVACETITQEMLFRVAGLPMVENCLSGYNSCMFAYGQTGSGKTYTMLGEIDELEVRPGPDRGMTPRIFEFLFARIKAEEESRKDEKLKYSCKCSFLEIYNEQITDLLDPSSTNLLIREDIKKGVYVENLTEFEVETVLDILKLLIQGAANRKVAATNMNRESSRSHSVFTCVIESQWEKDSTTNLRFARLNLVDLAGSERQKTSGAEGERLKEAANINKSLSTLGHVIMVLVDVAHGKQRHVPYRDSRLTFLLQDSLGGNSKTMIIANVSPSICCASETLSTLKFAQRAKLIQNNAVVNEDASGDVLALQHQIRLLKVELSFLKRQNVSRSLSFCSTIHGDDVGEGRDIAPVERTPGTHGNSNDLNGSTSLGSLTVSTKKLKSLETTLAGALRREKMADSATKHLEAEIEQLNRLVRQREEDTQCTKMMLRFREDKIRRMETLVDSLMPADSYLLEEKKALAEEIQLLRTRVDRNPEITRFALENIRLLDQLRRFQDFYQEGEREILLAEVSELRDQLLQFLDGNSGHDKYPNLCMESQLNNTSKELEDCRRNLNSCLEANAKLTREVGDLQAQLDDLKSAGVDPNIIIGSLRPHLPERVHEKGTEWKHKTIMKHTEEIINLQLELDVLKTILEEERVSHAEAEQRALHLNNKVEMANTSFLQISRQFEECENELKDARSLIEALESQQILSINELDELRGNFSRYEQENSILKRQLGSHLEGDLGVGFAYYEQKDQTSNCEEKGESELQKKLKKMQNALDKARRLNMKYQTNQASQTSHEQEMERVRQQVEAETAEAIVCLQEELQQQVELSNSKELEARQKLMVLEAESKELRERIDVVTRENKKLSEQVEKKDGEIRSIAKEWERLGCEIVEALSDGHCALDDAADQVEIGEQVGRLVRMIGEKEQLIDELQKRLEDAQMIGRDLEWKLRSLRGATLAITEAQQQESSEKEREILHLRSELGETVSVINELEKKIKVRENQVRNAEICATVAFVIVNRLSELTEKNSIVYSNEDDLVEAREKLNQLKVGVSALNSSMDRYIERDGKPGKQDDLCDGKSEGLTTLLTIQSESKCIPCGSEELEPQTSGDNHQENMTILLLKKEIESALCSLRAVQIQMSEINDEKEQIKKSGGQSLKIIESFAAQVLKLQTEMDDKEKQFEFRMLELSKKLQVVEDMVREANACCYQTKEVLALELSDAKAVAAQKTIEASGMLAKFEEAQETMKEADVMVNALMKASETAKFEIERYKKIEAALIDERESLINEVRSLKSCNALMEQQYEQLQEQFDSNLKETKSLVLALEDTFVQVQTTLMEEFKLITCDISCLKSQVVDCANVTKSWLEEIWFEIIGKDCAVSVLHLCHMGILLETVTGLNVEIGFLHHGLCESNSVIANLRENNVRAKKELESCSILKGKLLTDIKNSFDRISKKENETEKLSIKLSSFGRKISDLQMQEEIMLARSNSMGTELAILMKEMDQYNKSALVREELMRENDELRQKLDESSTLQEQIDFLIAALVAKDFELLVFASEMKQRNIALFNFHSTFEKLKEEEHNFYVRLKDLIGENLRLEGDRESLRHLVWELKKSCNRMSDLEVERDNLGAMLEEIKQELLFSAVERELGKQILMDQEVESTALKQEVRSLKEVTNIQCLDINSKCDELVLLREDSANANEQIKNLIGENLRLEGEIERHLVWELKSSNRMSDLEVERENLGAMLEEVKQELIFSAVEKEPCKQMLMDKEVESTALKQEVQSLKEVTNLQCLDINRKCDELALLREDSANANEQIKDFDHQTQLLHDEMDLLRDSITRLETSLDEKDIELSEIRGSYSVTVKALELRNWEMEILKKENERVLVDICSLQASISRLQAELDMKSAEQSEIESYNSILFNDFESKKLDMISLSEEMNTVKVKNRRLETEIGEANEARKRLLTEVQNMKTEHSRVFEDLEAKKLEFKSSSSQLHVLDRQNNDLTEEVARFKTDLESKIAELKEVQGCNREVCESLAASDEKNLELMSIIQKNENILTLLRSSVKHCLDSVPELVEAKNEKYIKFVDKMFREIFDCDEMASKFVTEAKCLEMCAKEVMSENLSLQADLLRKDEVLKGLQFDLSLLQESASNAKDQKDEIEEMVAAVELLEDDLDFKSVELEEALVRIQILESQLAQKIDAVCVMESELDKEQESLKLLSNENLNLKVNLEGLLVKKGSIAEELEEKSKLVERLEEELLEMGSSLDQMGFALQSANSDLCKVTKERDCLDAEVLVLKEQLEMAQSLADENEAIATEARQIAEARKAYAEEKEEEVKLLEKSVEELECTINVLENKVEIVKGEAERQRLQREELEMELQDVKHQMSTVHAAGSIMNVEARNVTSCGDDDLPRNLEEKVIELQEARKKIQILEKDLAEKEAEIVQCKAHISELTLHAEAQASEYKQKFKSLEAMAQQVKPEYGSSHVTTATLTKTEKNAVKPRGSGSPFKCIGLGLANQINSEKDEELSEGRLRIQELEALAATRQKEIFMLNTRLAAAESMTHDVIRDLLGVKLDMTNYASLLDNQQVQKMTDKRQCQNEESLQKEQELLKMKQQLDGFIEERAGWLDEINRRHAEMVAARVASEKLRQRDQFLTAENEMLKMENANHKKKVNELKEEVKKLSGQQNLQQRIHHHAKIKEENNSLKIQNDDLSAKFRRTETALLRARDELARYRASSGKKPYVDVDEEHRLKNKLEETEEERVQLAHTLLTLCTSILKAAGITRPVQDISPSVAEDALSQLKDRVATAEKELQDLKVKSKISGERIRLSELRQHA